MWYLKSLLALKLHRGRLKFSLEGQKRFKNECKDFLEGELKINHRHTAKYTDKLEMKPIAQEVCMGK